MRAVLMIHNTKMLQHAIPMLAEACTSNTRPVSAVQWMRGAWPWVIQLLRWRLADASSKAFLSITWHTPRASGNWQSTRRC